MKYADYYATLGVAPDASLDDIKKAYRALARKHHPDMSKAAGSEARFKEAAQAYATLKNPEKRAAYDELGRQPPGEEFSPSPQWRENHFGQAPAFDDMDLADLLAAMGRGRTGSQNAYPVPGQDYENTVVVTLEEAQLGTTRRLNLADGAGGHTTLEVTVPPGSSEGQKLRLRGKGGKGRHGGPDGDIYLHIQLAPHAVFRADGHDLYFDLLLSPWEAALGADVEVPTLGGPVVLTVPAGTRAGRKLRLRGRGLKTRQGGHGDLYASVRLDVPAKLTDKERELYRQMAEISTFNPRETQPRGNS